MILITSCNSKKVIRKINKQEIIENIIQDFSKENNGKVFNVKEFSESKDLYCFVISAENNKIWPGVKDSIGANSTYFPNKFKEIDNSLYIWNDSTIKINVETIEKLQKYKVIDSTYYKIQIGQLSEDNYPVIKSDDSKKSTFYYICKKNIKKHKKIISNKVLSVSKYPDNVCW